MVLCPHSSRSIIIKLGCPECQLSETARSNLGFAERQLWTVSTEYQNPVGLNGWCIVLTDCAAAPFRVNFYFCCAK